MKEQRGKYEQIALECQNYLTSAVASLYLAKAAAEKLGTSLASAIDATAGDINRYVAQAYNYRCLACKIEGDKEGEK